MTETLVSELKKYFTLCLSKAIDGAMIPSCGEQWFADFVKEEANETHPIVTPSHHAIETLDMQALLKVLYFRRGYASIVLTYYGLLKEGATFDNERHFKQFRSRLHNLIQLYRNGMDAHAPAQDVVLHLKDNANSEALYTYEDAARDMLMVARVFRNVTDDNGVSFFETMKRLVEEHKATAELKYYAVSAAIKQEQLALTESEFVARCTDMSVSVVSAHDTLCFATDDYHEVIRRIREQLATESTVQEAQRTHKYAVLLILVAVLSITLVAVVVWAILTNHSDAPSTDAPLSSSSNQISSSIDRIPASAPDQAAITIHNEVIKAAVQGDAERVASMFADTLTDEQAAKLTLAYASVPSRFEQQVLVPMHERNGYYTYHVLNCTSNEADPEGYKATFMRIHYTQEKGWLVYRFGETEEAYLTSIFESALPQGYLDAEKSGRLATFPSSGYFSRYWSEDQSWLFIDETKCVEGRAFLEYRFMWEDESGNLVVAFWCNNGLQTEHTFPAETYTVNNITVDFQGATLAPHSNTLVYTVIPAHLRTD